MKYLFFIFASLSLFADPITWENTGPSVQEYNSALHEAIGSNDLWAAIDFADVIVERFPTTSFAEEAHFVAGESYYKLDQLEYANNAFTAYLEQASSPKSFEAAIEYKFTIAEKFANGEKKRLFGSPKLPAWMAAEEDAIEIYDEVIAAVPHSELAAKSLLSKARVQTYCEDYKPAIETLDMLIRKFPKHDLAAESFLEKNKVFFLQCKTQSLDPAILDLAELNVRKFALAFPREPRVEEAGHIFADIQELFAQGLYETGCFFARTKKVGASAIYFKRVIAKYPNTEAALASQEKLEALNFL